MIGVYLFFGILEAFDLNFMAIGEIFYWMSIIIKVGSEFPYACDAKFNKQVAVFEHRKKTNSSNCVTRIIE